MLERAISAHDKGFVVVAGFYGVLEMSGNVLEWRSTLGVGNYKDYLNQATDDLDDTSGRLLRGGSWSSDEFDMRCANRTGFYQNGRGYSVRFRIVCYETATEN